MDNRQNNVEPAVQVPNWDDVFNDYPLAIFPQLENIELAGEGLFYTRAGDLASFFIRFTDPRFYTERIQIRIIEELSDDVILDVVPFQVAKGYGIKAFYMMTKPGRVRLDITVDDVPIPLITVGVDANDDYAHSLEISNMALLRLLNQETGRQRELQAVYNELNQMLEELPEVCRTALQSVTQATERSTAILNRAHRLIQQFPQPLGQAPADSPAAQGTQAPRNGSPPAPTDHDVGHSPPDVSTRQQLPTRRSSAPSSRLSPPREPSLTSEGARQPDDLKRKSGDDMGEQAPTKKRRWSAPSVLEGAEKRASWSLRFSASPTPTEVNRSPLSSDLGSTEVLEKLHQLLDDVIQGGQEDEAPTEDRPADERASWSLRFPASPSPTEANGSPLSSDLGSTEVLEKLHQLLDDVIQGGQQDEAPTEDRPADERASRSLRFPASPSPTEANGSPLSSDLGSTEVIEKLHELLDDVIQGGQEDEAPTEDRPADERASWSLRFPASPSPPEANKSPPSRDLGSTEVIEKLPELLDDVIQGDQEDEAPTEANRSPLSSDPGSTGVIQELHDLQDDVIQGDQEDEAPTDDRPAEEQRLSSPENGWTRFLCPSTHPRSSTSRRSSTSDRSFESVPSVGAIQGSPCQSLVSSGRSFQSLSSGGAVRGSSCPSLSSSDDTPQRNPRYNPYYWMRPLPRKNYRIS